MKKSPPKDPLFGLKLIALSRSSLPANEEDLTEEGLVQFAKWQICKVRNILWNDPTWDLYTPHEILIEFFSIKFDENESLKKEFEARLVSVKNKDLEWIERMEKKYKAEKQDKIKEEPLAKEPEEFEENFR